MAAGYPQIKSDKSRCKHIYFYYDHEDYGFMSVRMQTWARDYIFHEPQVLNSHMNQLLRYAFITGTSDRVLHWL